VKTGGFLFLKSGARLGFSFSGVGVGVLPLASRVDGVEFDFFGAPSVDVTSPFSSFPPFSVLSALSAFSVLSVFSASSALATAVSS
jgi:hypothetical protein